ncbi:VanZ family protein [Streptomyces sp. TRM 70361]|uniref:VanZ family protein n=1 Tax=Streptomyces sp. TRM 70361 TaxID=3116553 RepID=UPI002E7AD937|nr:VanZ family protein [Streptomyces sp. TRM 70361]MEE1942402.1 VanZ family protein [Streptomyces sp. TRM 70361]
MKGRGAGARLGSGASGAVPAVPGRARGGGPARRRGTRGACCCSPSSPGTCSASSTSRCCRSRWAADPPREKPCGTPWTAPRGPAPDPEAGGVNLSPLTAGGLTFWLNILMTVPLGFLLPLLSVRWGSALRVGLCGAAVSLGIELTQLLLLALGGVHVVDVNDLIANTAGALLGYLLFRTAADTRPVRALRPAVPVSRRRPPRAPAPTGRRCGPGGR